MKSPSLTTRSHLVIGYMILAFGWWSFHLWRQNDRAFEREKDILELKHPQQDIAYLPDYTVAENTWKSGRRMVVAEGLFFTLCLIWGLWVIRRSAFKEVALARQRRNFLLSITHELKSPIAGMRLVLETLGKRELSKEQRTPLISNGLKDADRLQNLVESLLLAARLEDNWRPMHEPLDIKKVVQDAADSLRIRFPEAQFNIQIPDGFAPIQADRMGMCAIVQNLLENALKYSPEGAPVDIATEQSNGHFRLRVADKGQGIPDEEKQSVFEKFYRMGNEETRHSTGTGLGLYIVQQVLKAHQGSVRISDNRPSGTVFEVQIPLQNPPR
jgi:two-component system phosphate regulon sensor histidine kinase PhoR